MAKKQETTELVAPQQSNALPPELAALAQKYAANAGMENIEQSDLKRPFYRIIQPTSKEVLVGNDRYLEDAKIGNWIESTISREVSTEVKIVPLNVIKGYSEFTPQNQGGGFLGFHLHGSDRVANAVEVKYGTLATPEGTELKETWQLFCLIDPIGKGAPIVGIIGFSGNSLAQIRKFMSHVQNLGYAMFMREYRLTTMPKHNKQYNSTTFIPDFNTDEVKLLPGEIVDIAGALSKQLDNASMQSMVSSTAEAAESGEDDIASTVEASMG